MLKLGQDVEDTRGQHYQVLRELSPGSQGMPYVARAATGEEVLLKTAHPHLATATTAKRLEALVALRLSELSPAVCAPHALLHKKHGLGAVARLAPGTPLHELLDLPDYDLQVGLGIAIALCRAYGVLEQHGIAHGDIAAANVMVAKHPAGYFEAYLIDFDNARLRGAPLPEFLGQLPYTAPEILRAHPAVGVSLASDRFALAVLLHEVLYQRHPFLAVSLRCASENAFKREIAQGARWLDDPRGGNPRPSVGRPVEALSASVHELFRRGLGLDPTVRPSAAEWQVQLAAALGGLLSCEVCGGFFVHSPTLFSCALCGAPALSLVLRLSTGRTLSLATLTTTVGREELDGDGTVSRRHATFRRRGHLLTVTNHSPNGLAVYQAGAWILVDQGEEVELSVGDHLRFAPGLEGVVSPQP